MHSKHREVDTDSDVNSKRNKFYSKFFGVTHNPRINKWVARVSLNDATGSTLLRYCTSELDAEKEVRQFLQEKLPDNWPEDTRNYYRDESLRLIKKDWRLTDMGWEKAFDEAPQAKDSSSNEQNDEATNQPDATMYKWVSKGRRRWETYCPALKRKNFGTQREALEYIRDGILALLNKGAPPLGSIINA